MRSELGVVVTMGSSGISWGFSLGDFLAAASGLLIRAVMPGVLCLVLRACVLGAACVLAGAVGLLVVVTGGAGPTLCSKLPPSEVGWSTTL